MSEREIDRRLLAIMSADVVSYSRLMGEDEVGTLRQLNKVRDEIFTPAVAQFSGRVFKLVGDGILVEFPSVVDAADCALLIQQEMSRREEETAPIRFRIGIHLGDVIVQGDDLYGEGVNIAARVEPLAPTGGIALSQVAFENIEGKVVAVFEKSGERELKNINKPVTIFTWPIDEQAGEAEKIQAVTGLQITEKPSIVVLPLSQRAAPESGPSFADGITEDIISGLSQFSSIAVISRNSAFKYKDTDKSPRELRRELGVNYIVQGNLRQAGERVRIAIDLVGSETGNVAWSSKFDGSLDDLMDFESELVQSIVAALPGQVLQAEKDRVARAMPDNMDAYEHFVRGRTLHHCVTKEENDAAVAALNRAIEIDPGFSEAYAWKACTLGQSVVFGFSETPDACMKEAFASLEKAMQLNESDIECNRLMCEVCMETDQIEKAEVHNNRVVAMNPNDPRLLAQRGELMTWQGKAEEGISWLEKALQLDPFGAPGRGHLLGRAYYVAKRYADAVNSFHLIVSPSFAHRAECAAAYAMLGDTTNAKNATDDVLNADPGFSVSDYVGRRPFVQQSDAEHLAEGMRKAGLPG